MDSPGISPNPKSRSISSSPSAVSPSVVVEEISRFVRTKNNDDDDGDDDGSLLLHSTRVIDRPKFECAARRDFTARTCDFGTTTPATSERGGGVDTSMERLRGLVQKRFGGGDDESRLLPTPHYLLN